MRQSTALAEQLEPGVFLEALNEYFECSAGAVIAHGGEVLRFVGDAVLAIFAIEPNGEAKSARLATTAALDSVARLESLNTARLERGLTPVDFGLALHLGEVMFGNIGAAERLEFSVIGPTANLVARLEDLTKAVGERIVVSGELAQYLPNAVRPLGDFELRGGHRRYVRVRAGRSLRFLGLSSGTYLLVPVPAFEDTQRLVWQVAPGSNYGVNSMGVID